MKFMQKCSPYNQNKEVKNKDKITHSCHKTRNSLTAQYNKSKLYFGTTQQHKIISQPFSCHYLNNSTRALITITTQQQK